MANTTVVQSTITNNELKRIQGQPEKKSLNLSDSKIIAILIKEALNARERINLTIKK
jgi:hypothetical protein